MQDKLDFIIKENFLTELQLEKLKKLLGSFGVSVLYEKKSEGYNVDISWDSSNVYRKSSRYAGRNKIHTDIDWNQVEYLRSIGMTNDEISEHLGVNLRTFYRRQSDNKKSNE